MWSHNIILDFLYFSGIYFYFPAIYVIIEDLLISLKNIIFAGNSYGDSVSTTKIIAESWQIFITGASSSEVPGASYTGPKTRRGSPESGTYKNEIL